MSGFFHVEPVSSRITVLRTLCGELLYLITGDTSAVLIDTAEGVGHLRDLVESLTSLPYVVLLSHGHVDHAPGSPEFDSVYLNKKDLPLYRRMCSLEERKGYLRACLGEGYAVLKDEDFVPANPEYAFHSLEGGMSFDLGGLHVDVFDFPGHTPGCEVFLVREERVLILGDACNNSTFLFDEDSSSVEEYECAVKKVRDELAGKYDHVYLMHHQMETGTDILDNMLSLCEEIKAGTTDDVPYEFMGHHACIAKKCNERYERLDGRCGNLIYNKEKIYRERA